MKKYSKIIVFLLITLVIIESCSSKRHQPLNKEEATNYIEYFLQQDSISNTTNKEVLIPDVEMAVDIAELYLFKVYGKELVLSERPYKIALVKGYWVIFGSMKEEMLGGTIEMAINSMNGEVVWLFHGK